MLQSDHDTIFGTRPVRVWAIVAVIFVVMIASYLGASSPESMAVAQPDTAVATSVDAVAQVASSPDVDDSLRRQAHAAGYVAYSLMFATVVLGLMTSVGTVRRSLGRQTLYDTHMLLSVMAMTATAMHAISHLFKHVDAFTIFQEFVPFTTPIHVTLGVIAFELMVLAAASVAIQRRLSYHRWHTLHRIAYPAYLLAIAHVLLSAHHRSDGVVITTLATTAGVVVIVGIAGALPTIKANTEELS